MDLILGTTLLAIAWIGGRLVGSREERETAPYVGTWAEAGAASPRTLVVARGHTARLGGTEARWRCVPPVPSRFPLPAEIEVDLPDGTTLRLLADGGGLVSSEGSHVAHWTRNR